MTSSCHNNKQKKVLVDASSAIILAKACLSSHLITTYSVIMAKSAFNEVTRHSLPGSKEYLQFADNKKISIKEPKRLRLNSIPQQIKSFGRGEADTLLLYYEGLGDFVLIDDGAAAKYCKQEQIPFINALLFPVILETAGIENQGFTKYFFDIICKAGRYSETILNFAQNCPEEEISFFLP